jgi:hypothetical protein
MIKNIFIDGTQINSSKILLSKIDNIGSAEVEFNTYQRGGASGQILSYPLYKGMVVNMTFLVRGDGIDDFILQRERFTNYFSNRYDVNYYTKRLGFELNNGVVKEIDVVFSTIGSSIGSSNIDHCFITVTAVSEKEYFEDRTIKTGVINVYSGGGMSVPMPVPMDMTVSPIGGSTVLVNSGNALCFPIMTIRGALATDFNIINDTVGKTITYDNAVLVNDRIVLDFYNRTAIKNSVSSVLGDISGDWFGLVPGTNQLRITSSGAFDDGRADVEFKNSYRNL